MRRIVVLVGAAGLLAAAFVGVAVAQQTTPSPLIVKGTAKATKAKGTKAKPEPISVTYGMAVTTADGSRPETEKTIDNAWGGVVSNGKLFPVCTGDQIDAAQSDAKCPKGSLVAVGKLEGRVGPGNDFSVQGVSCFREVRIYNGGQGKISTLLVGPPATCAGVGYQPPFPGKWVKKGGIAGGENLVLPIPDNIGHPFPGVLGAVIKTEITFKKQTVKVKGVTRGYVESIGCNGTRAFKQHIVGDPSGRVYDTNLKLKC